MPNTHQLSSCDLCGTRLQTADSDTVCQSCEAREDKKYSAALTRGMAGGASLTLDLDPEVCAAAAAAAAAERFSILIEYHAPDETLGDTPPEQCQAYRVWAHAELCRLFPRARVLVDDAPSLHCCWTDTTNTALAQTIQETCARLWDHYPGPAEEHTP